MTGSFWRDMKWRRGRKAATAIKVSSTVWCLCSSELASHERARAAREHRAADNLSAPNSSRFLISVRRQLEA